jgi:hypothetical protein
MAGADILIPRIISTARLCRNIRNHHQTGHTGVGRYPDVVLAPDRNIRGQAAAGNQSFDITGYDNTRPSEILSSGDTFGKVGKYPVHSHSGHTRNILGTIHRIDKYLETALMRASHEFRIHKVNAGMHRIRGDLSDKFLIRAVETADHNANPDVRIEFLHSS